MLARAFRFRIAWRKGCLPGIELKLSNGGHNPIENRAAGENKEPTSSIDV